jgi:hypothetical protein
MESTSAQASEKQCMLARLRTMRAGIMLIVPAIDEIGICLKNDLITVEEAAKELADLAWLPGVWIAPRDDSASELVRRWEASDADRAEPPKKSKTEYRTPQATVDTFFGWIVRQDEAAQERWLAEHPKDAPYLQRLWEARCATT